jgi:hypothetical protein
MDQLSSRVACQKPKPLAHLSKCLAESTPFRTHTCALIIAVVSRLGMGGVERMALCRTPNASRFRLSAIPLKPQMRLHFARFGVARANPFHPLKASPIGTYP